MCGEIALVEIEVSYVFNVTVDWIPKAIASRTGTLDLLECSTVQIPNNRTWPILRRGSRKGKIPSTTTQGEGGGLGSRDRPRPRPRREHSDDARRRGRAGAAAATAGPLGFGGRSKQPGRRAPGGGARRARVEGSRGREAVVATKGLRRAGGGVRWGEVGGVGDSTPPVKEKTGNRKKN